ncbi:MAG: hypothetical protein WDN09_00270 [bacterium]
MTKDAIIALIKTALLNLGIEEGDFIVEHPEELQNGDYSTNVALALAKNLKTNPKELAGKLKEQLDSRLPAEIEKVEIAGAGFINFYMSRKFFSDAIAEILKQKEDWGKSDISAGKKIMVEYTDPNPFKAVSHRPLDDECYR